MKRLLFLFTAKQTSFVELAECRKRCNFRENLHTNEGKLKEVCEMSGKRREFWFLRSSGGKLLGRNKVLLERKFVLRVICLGEKVLRCLRTSKCQDFYEEWFWGSLKILYINFWYSHKYIE